MTEFHKQFKTALLSAGAAALTDDPMPSMAQFLYLALAQMEKIEQQANERLTHEDS